MLSRKLWISKVISLKFEYLRDLYYDVRRNKLLKLFHETSYLNNRNFVKFIE